MYPKDVVKLFAKGEFYVGKDLFLQTDFFSGAVKGYQLQYIENGYMTLVLAFYNLETKTIWAVKGVSPEHEWLVDEVYMTLAEDANVKLVTATPVEFSRMLNGDDVEGEKGNPFEGDPMFQEQKMIKLILFN